MKKEEIYVVIDSEEKRLRAIQILTDAGETILNTSSLLDEFTVLMELKFYSSNNYWWVTSFGTKPYKITLNKLEQLLKPKQEEPIKLDALKLIAESYGFELVEKKREPKVGDFGKFLDSEEKYCCLGFIENINIEDGAYPFELKGGSVYKNFAHLTDEEKQQIQENW